MIDTLVSIIVPVYNAGSYLSPCVESLTSQTYRNIERILVDDGSTDGSGKVLDAYAAKDAGIRVIHKKNGGLVSAWKRGAAEASGRYVMFVDSDDWIDPDFAERLMAQATGRDDEIISAGYVIERENGKKQEVQSSALPGIYEGEKLMELQNELLGHESRRVILSRCMKLISRKLLLANETYTDESVRMGEDLTVMLPCLYTCGRLVLVDGCFGYHYRFVDTSMVHRYNPYLYGNIRKLGEILTRIAEDFDIPDGKTKARREYYYLMCLELKNQLRRDGDEKEIEKTIKNEIREAEMPEILRENPEKPADPAGMLLAHLVRHPGTASIRLVRWIFRRAG